MDVTSSETYRKSHHGRHTAHGWHTELVLFALAVFAHNAALLHHLRDVLERFEQTGYGGGRVAAICASPGMVLAPLGLLKDKKATGYPGFEGAIEASGATATGAMVEKDGRVVTGKGPAATVQFALTIVADTVGADKAKEVSDGMLNTTVCG